MRPDEAGGSGGWAGKLRGRFAVGNFSWAVDYCWLVFFKMYSGGEGLPGSSEGRAQQDPGSRRRETPARCCPQLRGDGGWELGWGSREVPPCARCPSLLRPASPRRSEEGLGCGGVLEGEGL